MLCVIIHKERVFPGKYKNACVNSKKDISIYLHISACLPSVP